MPEITAIVDRQDRFLYGRERGLVGPDEIYRVAAVWILDPQGRALLARRAWTKRRHPGLWGPAVAGTMEAGETYLEAALREAEEEVGLAGTLLRVGPKLPPVTAHNYFGQWFYADVPAGWEPRIDPCEVAETCWVTLEELRTLRRDFPEQMLPSFPRFAKALGWE